jgi:hypothetical protein
MKTIADWLEEKSSDLDSEVDLTQDSAVEQQAERLRAVAEADGYTAAQLNDACGGDIADFIRMRIAESGGVEHGRRSVSAALDGNQAGVVLAAPLGGSPD